MHDRALSTQRSAVHFLGTVVEKGDMETVFLFIDRMRELNIYSMMLRIALAMFVGGVLGFEREKKGRPAGFRTYMLVAMGAALTVILSQYLVLMQKTAWAEYFPAGSQSTDISRFAAQVINGVGFLGAGTIIVTGRQQVKGLTTAAGLWCAAAIGIALGAGFYEGAIITFICSVLTVTIISRVEHLFNKKYSRFGIYVEICSDKYVRQTIDLLENNYHVSDIQVTAPRSGTLGNVGIEANVHNKDFSTSPNIVSTELEKEDFVIFSLESI